MGPILENEKTIPQKKEQLFRKKKRGGKKKCSFVSRLFCAARNREPQNRHGREEKKLGGSMLERRMTTISEGETEPVVFVAEGEKSALISIGRERGCSSLS